MKRLSFKSTGSNLNQHLSLRLEAGYTRRASPITNRGYNPLLNNRIFEMTFRLAIFNLLLCAMIFNASSLIASAQATENAKAISGRVVNESGQALVGATVRLIAVASTGYSARTTSSDTEGRFSFPDVDAATYRIAVSQPGYVLTDDAETPRYFKQGDTATFRMMRGGVIAGRVATSDNKPVVAVSVRAIRLTDENNRPAPPTPSNDNTFERQTDDRGVYRIYSLPAGTYVVYAGSGMQYRFPRIAAYDGDAPTYHPSNTSANAARIQVTAGQETTGIDISYRLEAGRRIEGSIIGAATSETRNTNVALVDAVTEQQVAFKSVDTKTNSFTFDGLNDGDYVLTAQRNIERSAEQTAASAPRRLSVKGANLTGIELTLAPVFTVNGQVVFAAASEAEKQSAACAETSRETTDSAAPNTSEVTLTARLVDAKSEVSLPRINQRAPVTPDAKGAFRIHSLRSGAYQLNVVPVSEKFYVKSIQAGRNPNPKSPPAKAKPDTKAKLNTKAKLETTGLTASSSAALNGANADFSTDALPSNFTVTLADGAGRIEGKLTGAQAAGARIYLVPAEAAHAEHAWRYHTATANATFRFINLAPGQYFILARRDSMTLPERAMNAQQRTALRRDAEAANTKITVEPCAQTADINLKLQP